MMLAFTFYTVHCSLRPLYAHDWKTTSSISKNTTRQQLLYRDVLLITHIRVLLSNSFQPILKHFRFVAPRIYLTNGRPFHLSTSILPTMDGDLIIHGDAEWDAMISQLREQNRENSKPDDCDYIVCGRKIPTASNGAEAFPNAYYRLKEAALRGDLALVKTIYEEEWLSETATGRFSNDDLYNVFCEALEAGRTPVVAFLKMYHSRNIILRLPFTRQWILYCEFLAVSRFC